jgi:putative salt-induced outer membrane protein YdiY
MNQKKLAAVAASIALLCVHSVRADEVILANGDKLNGKVGQIAGGKMQFNSPVLGEITIDMANVQTFTTDEPAIIQPKGEQPRVTDRIVEASPETITTEAGQTFTLNEVRSVNPPPVKWTGFLLGNLQIARGNTETMDAGVESIAVLRRDTDYANDRFTLGGQYNFASVGSGEDRVTTKENVKAAVKYDRYFTEKLYGYANLTYEKDRIADLEYRLAPGIGLGYQWVESPNFNFQTEAGLSYVIEQFDPGGSNNFIAARLSYHVDKKLSEKVLVFHNLEFLPSLEDLADDYLINADAGVQADLVKNFFAQAKVEWQYDATPAPGRDRSDYRYLIGVGWRF